MKNARISFLLLSVFAFQKIECKKQQPAPKKAVTVKRALTGKRPVVSKKAAVVVEQEAHKVEVNERALEPNEVVAPSVVPNTVENPDGSITQTIVTVTPIEEEGKVITKTETWTWYDAAKIALGVGAATGAAYLAYQNNEDFRNGVNAVGSWSADQAQGFADSVSSLSSWWNGASAGDIKTILTSDPQGAVAIANNAIATATEAAIAEGRNPEEDKNVQDAEDAAAKIATGDVDALSEEQTLSLWQSAKEWVSENKTATTIATGAVGGATAYGALKFPALRNGLQNLSNKAGGRTVNAAQQRAQYSSGLVKAPDYAQQSELAQQVAKTNRISELIETQTAEANRIGASNPTGFAGYVTRAGESLKSGAERLHAAAGNAIREIPFTPGSNATQAARETAAQQAQAARKAAKEAEAQQAHYSREAARVVNRMNAAHAPEKTFVEASSITSASPQSSRGFRSDNYVNGVRPTVNPGLAKLTATQSEVLKGSAMIPYQAPIDGAVYAAGLGATGAVAAGANALNNSDMSAPENTEFNY